MSRIAFIFKSAPHGSSVGREGLDALLAALTLTEDVGIFFINDGIFQILDGQQPGIIFSRNYISTFKVLSSFYNIEEFWVCSSSLCERNLNKDSNFIIDVIILTADELSKKLTEYKTILTF